MKGIFVALFAALLLAACVTKGTKFDMADVEAFQPGITTYDEVVEKLGKPKSQNFAADGSKNVTWIWVQVVPGASQSRATRIAFDKDGKMVRVMSKVE